MVEDNQEVIAIFYDVARNRFIDEGGFWIPNIYEYVTPNDIILFRHNGEYMLVPHRSKKGVFIELLYPEEDDCYSDREIYPISRGRV